MVGYPTFSRYGSVNEKVSKKQEHTQPYLTLQVEGRKRTYEGGVFNRKRWFAMAVIGGLAVGAAVALRDQRAQLSSTSLATTLNTSTSQITEESVANDVNKVSPTTVLPEMKSDGENRHHTATTTAPSLLLPPLNFMAVNFYHLRDGKPGQDYPWLQNSKLIEPHRETTLSVRDPRDGFSYRWEIRSSSSSSSSSNSNNNNNNNNNSAGEPADTIVASGAKAVVVVKNLHENVIILEEVDNSNGSVARRLEEEVMVKYVRREIRTLVETEREELLDAMFELWVTKANDQEGKKIYGEDYADIWSINRLHFKGSSPEVCDHFHDGLGFLTSHTLLTNTFEFSLQRVNPKLALPYWDFTIEGEVGGDETLDGNTFQAKTSPMFQSSWFGSHDPDDFMVKDSRWAFTEIPKIAANNVGGLEPDVYGQLRSAWNVNSRRFLSRGMGEICGADISTLYAWPTCESHYSLATSYTDFYSWVWQSLYDPHGPVHIQIGGAIDCREAYQRIAEISGSTKLANKLSLLSFCHRKDLFRTGIFKCNGPVGNDILPSEVFATEVCGCLDYDLTEGDDFEYIISQMAFLEDYLADYDADTKRQIAQVMCTGIINQGDHLQASSSLDPTFWSAHPTIERLWMFSLLTGQITDFTWPDSNISYTDSDGKTVSEIVSLYSETCAGHHGSDIFPFDLIESGVDDFEIKTGIRSNPQSGNSLSNRDVLGSLDPRANELAYIYDTFEWPHCAGGEFDLDSLASWRGGAEGEIAGGRGRDGDGDPRRGGGKRAVFEEGAPQAPGYSGIKKALAEFKHEQEQDRAGA